MSLWHSLTPGEWGKFGVHVHCKAHLLNKLIFNFGMPTSSQTLPEMHWIVTEARTENTVFLLHFLTNGSSPKNVTALWRRSSFLRFESHYDFGQWSFAFVARILICSLCWGFWAQTFLFLAGSRLVVACSLSQPTLEGVSIVVQILLLSNGMW